LQEVWFVTAETAKVFFMGDVRAGIKQLDKCDC